MAVLIIYRFSELHGNQKHVIVARGDWITFMLTLPNVGQPWYLRSALVKLSSSRMKYLQMHYDVSLMFDMLLFA